MTGDTIEHRCQRAAVPHGGVFFALDESDFAGLTATALFGTDADYLAAHVEPGPTGVDAVWGPVDAALSRLFDVSVTNDLTKSAGLAGRRAGPTITRHCRATNATG